jgi:hypothetical protein
LVFERPGLGQHVSRRAVTNGDETVGPDRVKAAKAELSCFKKPRVDLDIDDAPVKPADTRDALPKQRLMIVVLDLKMMLAYKQALGPDWFRGHLREQNLIHERDAWR